jgi:hypothetical protein
LKKSAHFSIFSKLQPLNSVMFGYFYNNVIFLSVRDNSLIYETVLRDNSVGRSSSSTGCACERAAEDIRAQPDTDFEKAGDNAASHIAVQARAERATGEDHPIERKNNGPCQAVVA